MSFRWINIYELCLTNKNKTAMGKVFLLFFVVCFGLNLSAQTMHTLIFINEEEAGRQTDRRADMRKMKEFITDVASRIGYRNDLRTHSGSEFTTQMVDSELNSLNVEFNDIVIFYYHGHGGNYSNNNAEIKWPNMSLLDKSLPHTDVQANLEEKCAPAKLVLCIADCCNSFVYKQNPQVNTMETRFNDNIKKLFTGFSGQKFIMISASKPGQYGWSASTGSIFGDYFRGAINYYSETTSNPTWENVLSKAQYDTKSHNARGGHVSEPQYEIFNKSQRQPQVHSGEIKW